MRSRWNECGVDGDSTVRVLEPANGQVRHPSEPVSDFDGALEDGALRVCGQCADLSIELTDGIDEELSLLWPR
jgi:hypothetical protein